MTTLAASDSPQLYIPADLPYAWVSMEMLFWALGILAALGLAALAVAVYAAWEVRRTRRLLLALRRWAQGVDPLITSDTGSAPSTGRHAHPDDLEVTSDAPAR